MSIFTKPIEAVTYDEVVAFCDTQATEGFILDYKREFPAELEKTISAFANTYGGTIIIGVEDSDGKPKLPVAGIQYTEGLRERVEQISVTNIYPPFIPSVQVCTPQGGKTFVVIRVDQSNIGPHAVKDRTRVYVRTGSVNSPETLASVDQIEWLRNRRAKSEELRATLLTECLERFRVFCDVYKQGIAFGELTLSVIPLYPHIPFCSPSTLKSKVENLQISVQRYGISFFPPYENRQPVQGGIQLYQTRPNRRVTYTEVNCYGSLLHKYEVGLEKPSQSGSGKEEKILYVSHVLHVTDLFLEYSGKVLEAIGASGLVEVSVGITKIAGIRMFSGIEDSFFESERDVCLSPSISSKRIVNIIDLRSGRPSLLVDLVPEIAWSLGFESLTGNTIRSYLERYQRL